MNKQTIVLLKVNHPVGKTVSENSKLHCPLPMVENIIFDAIEYSMVLDMTKITQGGSEPSEMNADSWRQILVSRDYGDGGKGLCKAWHRL